jgi:cytochrome c oxidase cbb3-type subunit 4
MEGLVEFARSIWGLWLMILFVGIVAWTFWPSRRRKLEEHGKIPFRNDPD